MAKLARGSSGMRHLRWAREVVATAESHGKHNYLLSQAQKDALAAEVVTAKALVAALEGATGPYRAFIESAYLSVRADQRVADYLCDEAQRNADARLRPFKKTIDQALKDGFASIVAKNALSKVLSIGRERTVELARGAAVKIRSLPPAVPATAELADALDQAANLLDAFNKARASDIDPKRQPLKTAVERAVFELREGLDKMDGRLRTHFTQEFIDSLYPELGRRGAVVADEPDEDDDSAGPPEPAPAPG